MGYRQQKPKNGLTKCPDLVDHYILMLYQPDEGSCFVCLKPQSQVANGHHLAGYPGLRLLARGDRMSIGMTLTVVFGG